MKKTLLKTSILSTVLLSSIAFADTVKCGDKEVGSTFTVGGNKYLVVDDGFDSKKGIRNLDLQNDLIDGNIKFCTSHVTNMKSLWTTNEKQFATMIDFAMARTRSQFNQYRFQNMYAGSEREDREKNIKNLNVDINDWDTSNVTNMSYMFSDASKFNQPMGDWNTSNVTNMDSMFEKAKDFNQSIGEWDTSNVANMTWMFFEAVSFNQPIDRWNTSNVTDMSLMFYNTSFNQPLNNWDVSNVSNMRLMFYGSSFNQALDKWNVSSVINMYRMFNNVTFFKQNLSSWNVSNVLYYGSFLTNTKMQYIKEFQPKFKARTSSGWFSDKNSPEEDTKTIFCKDRVVGDKVTGSSGTKYLVVDNSTIKEAVKHLDTQAICTSKVTDMEDLFNLGKKDASDYMQTEPPGISLHIENWDTSNVTNMKGMFRNSFFNGDIRSWDVSNVTTMAWMFDHDQEFSQNLNNWNTSNVTNMAVMFSGARSFNYPLDNWDTSKVTLMAKMFLFSTEFNQSIGNWDTSKVTNMSYMFNSAYNFNQPLGKWDISSVTESIDFADNSSLSQENLPKFK